MTSKERLMCAINLEKPDRLPVSIHQWQAYHLKEFLGGISDLEACRRFGFDAQIQLHQPMGQHFLSPDEIAKDNTETWRDEPRIVSEAPDDRVVHHEITTPEGVLTYKTAGDRKTTWITEHLIKDDDDIALIEKYMPVPRLDVASANARYEEVGDAGILRGTVWGDQAGCWQHACCLSDINELIIKCYDDPDWVHSLLRILLEKKLRFVESMKGARFDLIETGGGAASSTVISPDFHERFCLAYDRPLHDALREAGYKVTYHTCGGTVGLEDLIVANGCDVSETCAPPSVGGNQEPWEFAEKIDGRIALIGGVDQFSVGTSGSKELIEQTVQTLFSTIGKDGGYICAYSDHFFDIPPEKLQWFVDAARECVYTSSVGV